MYDDDDNKPVWSTEAMGALFRVARRIYINPGCVECPMFVDLVMIYAFPIKVFRILFRRLRMPPRIVISTLSRISKDECTEYANT
jgi:hypothetical protein